MRWTILAAALLLSVSASAQTAHYRTDRSGALLPDDRATPGVAATTDKKVICGTKWGKDERHVTASMRRKVVELYGADVVRKTCRKVAHRTADGKVVRKGCELDHLLSRENGGADDYRNLWFQPYLTPSQPGAYQKDELENWLHKQVCEAGTMTVAEVQRKLVGDWHDAFLEMRQAKEEK